MKGVDKLRSQKTANESHMIDKAQAPPPTKWNPLSLTPKE